MLTEGQYRQDRGRPRYEQNYRRDNTGGNVRSYGRQNSRGEYRNSYRNDSYDRSRNRSRERLFSRNYSNNARDRSTSNSRSRSGSRASTNRDRIQCYKCREYDHFTRDCPTSRDEKEIEQLQQMLNLGDEQTSVTPSLSSMQDNFSRTGSEENVRTGHLNFITGRNGPTAFLPLSPKIGGQVNHSRPNVGQYLTREQANYVYKKTELGEVINTDTLQQELEHKRQLNRLDDTNGEANPYKELIVNDAEKIEPLLAQMEQWSILSNMLNYIQYDRHPKNHHNLGISTVNKYRNSLDIKEERDVIELDFGPMPNKLKEEYLDIYEGIQSEILNTTRFDKNSDESTTSLGKSDRSKNDKLKAEESFPISEQVYTLGKLLDGTEGQLLLDTGASKFSCQNLITCAVNHSILYQNLPQKHREFR